MAGIKPMDLLLSRIVRETADTVTLYFLREAGAGLSPTAGGEPFVYKAGQFCTIDPHQFKQLEGMVGYFEQVKGKKETTRAYSMSSAPGETELAVTVKEEVFEAGKTPYPPVLSGLLVHGLTTGMRVRVVGFTGPYVLPDPLGPDVRHVLHVCAGSGIVPNFSILKDALARDLPLRHTLLYANRTSQDIIFRDSIDALRARHPRLSVRHALSREPEAERLGPDYHAGRITAKLLVEALAPDPHTLVFVCGPGITPHEARAARKEGRTPEPRFLESMLALLKELGVPKERLHYESYG